MREKIFIVKSRRDFAKAQGEDHIASLETTQFITNSKFLISLDLSYINKNHKSFCQSVKNSTHNNSECANTFERCGKFVVRCKKQ